MRSKDAQHLAEDQILQAAIGAPTAEEAIHAGECMACNEELLWLNRSLLDFCDSVHRFAEQQPALAERNWQAAAARQHRTRSLVWTCAVLALLLLLAAPAYRIRQQQQRELQARQDQALMQQIDENISSAVPGAMEPLAKLAAWNSTQNSTQPAENGEQQ